MIDTDIMACLRLAPRFLRSVELTRDFRDPNAFTGYCLTQFGSSCLGRMAEGLQSGSGRRAWRLTGDYGSGKSSFALLLASTLNDAKQRLPRDLYRQITEVAPQATKSRYIPLLVVGSRQPMATAILERLQALATQILPGKVASEIQTEVRHLLRNTPPPDGKVVEVLRKTTERIIATGRGQGLLIVLDEVGKFLEYAAASSSAHDIFLLQTLAEAASRSADTPIFLVCLLHQGFDAYADQLSQSALREWEKIAGRLEEIAFNHPLDQVMLLIESALSVRTDALPPAFRSQAKHTMEKAVELGWYGGASNKRALAERAVNIFPMDPFVLPALLRTFHRFGQNERSLFSFIYSFEPFGLRTFASRSLKGVEPYRLYDFYDYVRSNFGHRLAVISYRSRWSVIESMIESFITEDPLELRVLKTVGILNLINAEDLLPTEDRLVWSIAGADDEIQKHVHHALKTLKSRRVLHYRGSERGYCLWPYTSVDIEKAFDDAKRNIPSITGIADVVVHQLDARPIVARRHYIQKGNLRYFSVNYCSITDLPKRLTRVDANADGQIVIPLCETEVDRQRALGIAGAQTSAADKIQLVAVPLPLEKLSGLVLDAQRWDWIVTNTPELNSDPYARDEVSRYRAYAQNKLQTAIQDYVGLTRLSGKNRLSWFYRGKPWRLESGREVLSFLSELCDKVYYNAPLLKNELVNRHNLSSAAAAARMRLIEAMFAKPNEKLLGMPEERKPPEMSMYLSVLGASGIHRQVRGEWVITDPPQSDKCHLKPALHRIRQLIEEKPDTRIGIQTIFEELRKPPFGLRDGIIPILLAVIAIAHEQEVALYENGTFLREVGKDAFLRMTKAHEKFDIQYCRIEGVRSEIFTKLARVLELPLKHGEAPELLDVVKHLCLFVAQLPEYVRNTKRLSKEALAVRNAILMAREPIRLIFHELPPACGSREIEVGGKMTNAEIIALISRLKSSLDDLRESFPALQARMRQALMTAFACPTPSFTDFRTEIAGRAERLVMNVSEPKFKAFCLRLMDEILPEGDWLESLGSYLALRPPSKWRDEEEDLFDRDLAVLSGRFKRVESTVFGNNNAQFSAEGIRVAITKATGEERQEVIYLTKEDKATVAGLKKVMFDIIARNGKNALIAASQAIWEHLADVKEDS